MALPLGKLSIIVGAGILGSVLAKEGRMSNVSDFLSGAFKIALRQISQGDSTQPTVKPRNDALLAQVNNLRQELQYLASNRSMTIVTTNETGSGRYGIVVVLVVVGSGYFWWKGWKLPDMMFATRRGLSDACTSIAKQLDDVYSSLSATKRALSSKIQNVDSKLDEFAKLNAGTSDEVSKIQGKTSTMGKNIRSVRETVESLGTKISQIEGMKDISNDGIKRLCDYALTLENSRTVERIQVSPSSTARPVLERAQITHSSRTASLPASVLLLEPQSPTSSGSHQVQRPEQNPIPASGPMEPRGISAAVGESTTLKVSYATIVSEETNNGSSSSGFYGRFFRRTFSATQGMLPRMQS